MKILIFCLLAILSSARSQTYKSPPVDRQNYEKYVTFRCWRNASNPIAFISTPNVTLESQGCPTNSNFSVIIHGYLESVNSTWVRPMVNNLLKHSNGCVCYVDYNPYSQNPDYFNMVNVDYKPILSLVIKFLKQVGNYPRIFMFGFSFGARLAVEAGYTGTNSEIGRLDLCDPAGPGFPTPVDPKLGGKFVACIHTEAFGKGTGSFTCPQSWRMGNCGSSQPASGGYPMASHGLCPHFYNAAFDYPCTAAATTCAITTKAANISSPACKGARMGYLATFDRTNCVGELFVKTGSAPKYCLA